MIGISLFYSSFSCSPCNTIENYYITKENEVDFLFKKRALRTFEGYIEKIDQKAFPSLFEKSVQEIIYNHVKCLERHKNLTIKNSKMNNKNIIKLIENELPKNISDRSESLYTLARVLISSQTHKHNIHTSCFVEDLSALIRFISTNSNTDSFSQIIESPLFKEIQLTIPDLLSLKDDEYAIPIYASWAFHLGTYFRAYKENPYTLQTISDKNHLTLKKYLTTLYNHAINNDTEKILNAIRQEYGLIYINMDHDQYYFFDNDYFANYNKVATEITQVYAQRWVKSWPKEMKNLIAMNNQRVMDYILNGEKSYIDYYSFSENEFKSNFSQKTLNMLHTYKEFQNLEYLLLTEHTALMPAWYFFTTYDCTSYNQYYSYSTKKGKRTYEIPLQLSDLQNLHKAGIRSVKSYNDLKQLNFLYKYQKPLLNFASFYDLTGDLNYERYSMYTENEFNQLVEMQMKPYSSQEKILVLYAPNDHVKGINKRSFIVDPEKYHITFKRLYGDELHTYIQNNNHIKYDLVCMMGNMNDTYMNWDSRTLLSQRKFSYLLPDLTSMIKKDGILMMYPYTSASKKKSNKILPSYIESLIKVINRDDINLVIPKTTKGNIFHIECKKRNSKTYTIKEKSFLTNGEYLKSTILYQK